MNRNNLDQDDKCYACGKAFRGGRRVAAVTSDGSMVYVGLDCSRQIERNKSTGWRHPRIAGPLMFPPRTLEEYRAANLLRT